MKCCSYENVDIEERKWGENTHCLRKGEGGDGGYFGVQKSVEEEKTITVTGLFSYSITMSNWGM